MRRSVDEANATITELRQHINQLETQNSALKQQCQDIEAEADETVTKIRSEMTETLVLSDERHQSQISSLERKIKEEKDSRMALESKLEDLARSSEAIPLSNGATSSATTGVVKETKQKKLQSATGQADILQSALAGFGGDESDDDVGDDESAGDEDNFVSDSDAGPGSFAAMEQLSQGLKGARLELQALRKQLASSEETRESLVAELTDARAASEKLPLFEAKVAELTEQVRMKDLEIQGLTEDLLDVKNLYRGQLDMLLEKAAEEKKEDERGLAVADEEEPVHEDQKEDNEWTEIGDPSVLQL